MDVLILAAGYAVRLQPLTLNMPKSLLEVAGKKILDRILDKLIPVKDAVGTAYVISNEKYFQKFKEWLNAREAPFEIMLINDGSTTNENRLGAIRDMALAIDTGEIDGDLLVIAGDNLFEFDLKDFLAFASSRPDRVITAFRDIGDFGSATRFGVAKVDREGKVVDFEEKPKNPKSTLISTGIYYFPKDKLRMVKEYIRADTALDAPGNYIKWLASRGEVYGYVFDGDWFDIGDQKSYEEANKRYEGR